MKKDKSRQHERIESGVQNLDEMLCGGLPKGSVSVIGGTPGAGKTTMALQICFHQAAAGEKVIYFQTLSEPVPKTIKNMSAFDFFDSAQVNKNIFFCDLGGIMRSKGLKEASAIVVEQMKKVKPSMVVIDSFRVFEDLAGSDEVLRKFTYEVAVNLMAWECTALLLGEYSSSELEKNPLSSIVDGIFLLTTRQVGGNHQRFIRIAKMRGTKHDQNPHAAEMTDKGIELFPVKAMIPARAAGSGKAEHKRRNFSVPVLDQLLKGGAMEGSTVLVAGEPGAGKTLLLLESLCRSSQELGEKGIYFSFLEPTDRLLAIAKQLGWNLEKEVQKGNLELHFLEPDTLLVERDLMFIHDRITKFRPARIAIDSVSAFFHMIESPVELREKFYLLSSIIAGSSALGLVSAEIPSGSTQVSKSGVEEAMADGVVHLSTKLDGLRRSTFIEVLKMRATGHVSGPRPVTVGKNGLVMVNPEKT